MTIGQLVSLALIHYKSKLSPLCLGFRYIKQGSGLRTLVWSDLWIVTWRPISNIWSVLSRLFVPYYANNGGILSFLTASVKAASCSFQHHHTCTVLPQLWLTFAPVADQSALFLHVGLPDINWLSLVFMVVSIPFSLVTTWMLDTLGLRITVGHRRRRRHVVMSLPAHWPLTSGFPSQLILGSWLNMLGAVLRYVGTLLGQRYVFPVVMLGQTLGALAQPLIIFTPTKQVALWFADNQRATANTIATMCELIALRRGSRMLEEGTSWLCLSSGSASFELFFWTTKSLKDTPTTSFPVSSATVFSLSQISLLCLH